MNWNNRTYIRFICPAINGHSCLLPIPMPLILRKLKDLIIFTMQPEFCRRRSRKRQICMVQKTYYLVNGSTCGLLAAISAAVPRGEKILVARNCHKAVYHAMYLRQLVPVYLYPEDTAYGIQGQVTPQMVQKQLKQTPDIRAVVITSPTYDGVVSDIKNIADTVHAYGIPLIVDEAHGAHFGFPRSSRKMPQGLVRMP